MPHKSILELETEAQVRYDQSREAERVERERAWPARPHRVMTVAPSGGFKRVLAGWDGSWIEGETEVDASDTWVWRRIRDGELEIVVPEHVKEAVEQVRAAVAERKAADPNAPTAEQPAPEPPPPPVSPPPDQPQPAE